MGNFFVIDWWVVVFNLSFLLCYVYMMFVVFIIIGVIVMVVGVWFVICGWLSVVNGW